MKYVYFYVYVCLHICMYVCTYVGRCMFVYIYIHTYTKGAVVARVIASHAPLCFSSAQTGLCFVPAQELVVQTFCLQRLHVCGTVLTVSAH